MNEHVQYFLEDFSKWLYERAQEAQQVSKHPAPDTTENGIALDRGDAQGLYEIFSHFVNQAEFFGISRELLGLASVDTDQLLAP